MRLRLFKPLFKLFNLPDERITYLLEQLCWVEVLKKLEHLGKLVLKEATSTHT